MRSVTIDYGYARIEAAEWLNLYAHDTTIRLLYDEDGSISKWVQFNLPTRIDAIRFKLIFG